MISMACADFHQRFRPVTKGSRNQGARRRIQFGENADNRVKGSRRQNGPQGSILAAMTGDAKIRRPARSNTGFMGGQIETNSRNSIIGCSGGHGQHGNRLFGRAHRRHMEASLDRYAGEIFRFRRKILRHGAFRRAQGKINWLHEWQRRKLQGNRDRA